MYIINRNHTVIVLSLSPFYSQLSLTYHHRSPSLIPSLIHEGSNFHDLVSYPRSIFHHSYVFCFSRRPYRHVLYLRIDVTDRVDTRFEVEEFLLRGRENLSSLGQSVYKDTFYRPPSTTPLYVFFIPYLPVNPSLIAY